jgi:hypothetical protein
VAVKRERCTRNEKVVEIKVEDSVAGTINVVFNRQGVVVCKIMLTTIICYRVINTRNYKKHICGLRSIIDKSRICRTEGETIEHIISSCTVLAQSEYKKRHDIFAKIIHMNLAVKFKLLKGTQPHYIYKPKSYLENDNYKLYFDRTVLTDIHIQHNRPDIIILSKQQKQTCLLDIAVPNSHNITQTYNTKINKYLELSVAMRNLWCLEKKSILPLIISATRIVPQILDLENTLVVEIQKGKKN